MSSVKNLSRPADDPSQPASTIVKTILSDPIHRWALGVSSNETFVVGGCVRDLLLGHAPNDRDYVVQDSPEKIARLAAKKFQGTLVTLRKGETYRTVIRAERKGDNSQVKLDFTILKSSIYNDLLNRDFTLNAIAWSQRSGILDPMKGQRDLKSGIIRAVRPGNLRTDPLRMLRAYRIAAELGFSIERKTRESISTHGQELLRAAPERITHEVFTILNLKNSSKYLRLCLQDGILQRIIILKKRVRKKYLSVIQRNIRDIGEFDRMMGGMFREVPGHPEGKKLRAFLEDEQGQGLKRAGLVRLFLLLRGLPPEQDTLRLSRTLDRAVRDMITGYRAMSSKRIMNAERISRTMLYGIFRNSGRRVCEMAMIFSIVRRRNVKQLLTRASEFLKIHNRVLLNGNEVQAILNLRAGEKIGKILDRLKGEQLRGKVRTKREARRWITSNYT